MTGVAGGRFALACPMVVAVVTALRKSAQVTDGRNLADCAIRWEHHVVASSGTSRVTSGKSSLLSPAVHRDAEGFLSWSYADDLGSQDPSRQRSYLDPVWWLSETCDDPPGMQD
jgi:hypothetical protein